MYGIFKRVVWGKNFKIDIKIRYYKTDIIIIIEESSEPATQPALTES